MSFELTYYFDPSKFEEYFREIKEEIPLKVSEEENIVIAKNTTPESFVKMWIHSQITESGNTKVKVIVLVKSASMKNRIIKIFGPPEKVERVKPTLLDFALAILEYRDKKSYDEIINAVMDHLGLTKGQVTLYLRMLRSGASLPSTKPEIKDAYNLLEKKK